PEYEPVRAGFDNNWLKPGQVALVEHIYAIQEPSRIRAAYEWYSPAVGNILRRFHGTSCGSTCNFVGRPQEDPCGLGSCTICNICMHGFKLDGNVGATARRTGFGLRYRNGIYFSSVSGKANDYAAGTKRVRLPRR
ncbi:unnamed protein product, partial [Scytosiphon promiscuus]